MACSNCFNGCAEIVSDQCVKYTGVDIPILGIQNGDSLSYVEQTLIGFLTSTLDGTGIKIDIPQNIICQLVSQYLPTCGDITVVDLITALIKAACDLQAQVTNIANDVNAIEADLNALEGPYDVDCLTGVTSTSGTHNILQAVIDKLCAFIIDVETNYVQLADLDALIAAYLAANAPSTKVYTKMIPYVAVEYYGDLVGKFDVSGAGIVGSDWEKVYLCNGLNGTPDKRGRVPVGVINGVGGGPLDPAVDPAVNPTFNPNYSISGANSKSGTNSVVLTTSQLPSHAHTAVVTPSSHEHFVFNVDSVPSGTPSISPTNYAVRELTGATDLSYAMTGNGTLPTAGKTSSVTISTSVLPTGGGNAHQNNQPALACYYIMYIP